MTRYENPKAGEWVYPLQGYKMACCDCGLVHKLDWAVHKLTERDGKYFTSEELPWGEFRVAFAVYRDNRATGQMRRKRSKGK